MLILLRKPFQVISKLQVRYTGIFQDIDQDTQTLCLSEGEPTVAYQY